MGLFGNLFGGARTDNIVHVLVCGGIVAASSIYSAELGLDFADAALPATVVAIVLVLANIVSLALGKRRDELKEKLWMILLLMVAVVVGAGYLLIDQGSARSTFVQTMGLSSIGALGFFHLYRVLVPCDPEKRNTDEFKEKLKDSRLSGFSSKVRHLSTAVGLIAIFYTFGEDNAAQVNGVQISEKRSMAAGWALGLILLMRLADTLMDHEETGGSFAPVKVNYYGRYVELVLVLTSIVSDAVMQVNMSGNTNERYVDWASLGAKAVQLGLFLFINAQIFKGEGDVTIIPLARQAFATAIIALDAYALGGLQRDDSVYKDNSHVLTVHLVAIGSYVAYDQAIKWGALDYRKPDFLPVDAQ